MFAPYPFFPARLVKAAFTTASAKEELPPPSLIPASQDGTVRRFQMKAEQFLSRICREAAFGRLNLLSTSRWHSGAMDPRIAPLFFLARPETVELVLRLPDGSPWSLTFSPGMELFIGRYPRLDGIDPGGPLLSFTPG
jgi:hypothetical protein